MNLINNSKDDKFPKTLEIRNTEGGMIWQTYHINNIKEAEILAKNSFNNGFRRNQTTFECPRENG